MRSDSEKKSIVKSIKLSPIQEEQIKAKAQEKNMTFSAYMVDVAMHGNNNITPELSVKLQSFVNLIKDIYEDIDSDDYIKKETLKQQTDDLCHCLGVKTPQKKFYDLTNNITTLVKEVSELWES